MHTPCEQLEYPRWSLRCLVVSVAKGSLESYAEREEACSSLDVPVPDDGRQGGHLVHRMLMWLGTRSGKGGPMTPPFAFLLKAELSTVVRTDLLPACASGCMATQHPPIL